MRYTFRFSGGPLDGNGFHFDPDNLAITDCAFGGQAWLDTRGGEIGIQFTVKNPDTPSDENGTVWEFKKHVYEVTARDQSDARFIVSAKHVCALSNSRSGSYEQKFSDFIRMLAETKEETILIHHPEVIGDTFEEIVESLNRLADAGKSLVIVPRSER